MYMYIMICEDEYQQSESISKVVYNQLVKIISIAIRKIKCKYFNKAYKL
jgi:hypothetical protein